MRPRYKVAASFLLLAGSLGMFLYLLSTPQSLYAQALAAIYSARTIHVVGVDPRKGDDKAYEIWYERGVGVNETAYYNGDKEVRIDDGTYQWRYSSAKNYAAQTMSTDPIGVVTKILNVDKFLRTAVRDSAGDKEIDGFHCALYISSYPNNPEASQLLTWVDEDWRIRQFEELHLRDGKWITVELMKVDYDIPVDRKQFAADFGPGVNIKSFIAERSIENMFDLEDAMVTREVFGLVFAVHELKRCENGFVYVVSSIRPSQETIRELGPIISVKGGPSDEYGSFGLKPPWTRDKQDYYEQRWYQPCDLAQISHNGIDVIWYILIPEGTWLEKAEQLELGAYVHTRGRLQKKLEEAGMKWFDQFNPLVTLPLPDKTSSLSETIKEVHTIIGELSPVAWQAVLWKPREPRPSPDGPNGEKLFTNSDQVNPQRITEEEYARQTQRELENRLAEMRGQGNGGQ